MGLRSQAHQDYQSLHSVLDMIIDDHEISLGLGLQLQPGGPQSSLHLRGVLGSPALKAPNQFTP